MKNTLVRFAAFYLTLACSGYCQILQEKQEPLEELLARIPLRTDMNDRGIRKDEDALAKKIQSFGAIAAPRMLALLESKDDKVRFFAGYVLRDLEGLKEEHLDALIRAHSRGDGWIPPAIGRIATPRAIAYLVEDIKKHPQTQTQVTWALKKAGKHAAVPLAEIFRTNTPIDRNILAVVQQVYAEMGTDAAPAVPVLLEIVKSNDQLIENRISAIYALGAIGVAAAETVPTLKQLSSNDPAHFKEPVKSAIVGIGTSDAAAIFIEALQTKPSTLVLRDLSELGKNGTEAGPAVLVLLKHPDWEIRVTAARALGYIEYAQAVEDLRHALRDPNNWRMPYVSAESLGRLKAKAALGDLDRLAQKHWYPPVRQAAATAIKVINGKASYESRKMNFAFGFFGYQQPTMVNEDEPMVEYKIKTTPAFVAEPDALNKAELQQRTYDVETESFGTEGRQVHRHKTTPVCGLRLGNSYLLAGDRGEWGGELVHLDGEGRTQTLAKKNTRGIHKMPFGIFAFTGLAHILLNSGEIYLVSISPEGKPTAAVWKTLPGAPRESGKLKDGSLFVSCQNGDIIVTPQGELMMADPVYRPKS